MKSVQQVRASIGNIPYMTLEQAELMTRHIADNKIHSILELGFFHGASTCYMANAISKYADGHVVAIDRERARDDLEPNIETLLSKLDLLDRVSIHYEPNSYIWRLMKLLELHPEPIFDMCYLDGAHNWFVDGFAFFLVDRLLKPGGWLILDDLNWRYADSPSFKNSPTLANMPSDEAECYQIRKIYELLVQRQPGYGNFREDANWGFAQKLADQTSGPARVETKIVYQDRRIGLGEALIKLGKRLGMR